MKKSEIKKIRWMIKQRFSTCPRCGAGYEYIEIRRTGSNYYVYFVHDRNIQGKRRIKKCYAGALSEYIYVQRFQYEAIQGLRGIHDPQRFFDYFVQLAQYFSEVLAYQSPKLSKEQLKTLRKRLEEILYLLDMTLSETK